MLRILSKKGLASKGQTTLEYAVLIIVVIGALISIQSYLKRAVSGRMQTISDEIGDQFSPGNTREIVITETEQFTRDTLVNGTTRSELLENDAFREEGAHQIVDVDFEFWGSRPN